MGCEVREWFDNKLAN